MPRHSRLICPGIPHHVTQRGNRRGQVFFSDGDRLVYLHWLREYAVKLCVDVLAYCLMSNHVHLILVPHLSTALPLVMRPLHTRFAQRVNRSKDWKGHLWQGRYFASALDEAYFWAAIRYVERNPVRAGMVERAEDYAWSSAKAHCGASRDPVLTANHRWLQEFRSIGDWSTWLAGCDDPQTLKKIRECARQSLPCGSDHFIERLEISAGRKLTPRAQGRPGTSN
jgi:putative transposase